MKVLKVFVIIISVLLSVLLLKAGIEYHERPGLELISH